MRSATTIIATALAAALGAQPALADVKAGVDAWSRGDYVAAIRQWTAPAEAGDADAQFNLAQAYKLGKGVPADARKAEGLYLKAAQQGHLQAADNYGLMLFQTGRRTEAMGWLVPSADRGEPRAQYVLGTAFFNGDLVARDPVRAYALMTRATAAGLDQARTSLATMDEAIPLEQRQQAIALAAELETRAAGLRGAQFAAAELAGAKPRVAIAHTAPGPQPEPVTAGADFARPVKLAPPVTVTPWPAPKLTVAKPAPSFPAPLAVAKAPSPGGAWRIQLGAFGVSGNAEALWARVKGNAALAGRERFLVPAGRLTRLQAGPFATRAEARAACAAVGVQGCLTVGSQ